MPPHRIPSLRFPLSPPRASKISRNVWGTTAQEYLDYSRLRGVVCLRCIFFPLSGPIPRFVTHGSTGGSEQCSPSPITLRCGVSENRQEPEVLVSSISLVRVCAGSLAVMFRFNALASELSCTGFMLKIDRAERCATYNSAFPTPEPTLLSTGNFQAEDGHSEAYSLFAVRPWPESGSRPE